MTSSISTQLHLIEEELRGTQPSSSSPDEYRELCLRKLSLDIAKIVHELTEINENDLNLPLEKELNQLVELIHQLESQENFTSTAKDQFKRTETLVTKENKLFSLLRQLSLKLRLESIENNHIYKEKSSSLKDKLLMAAQQIAIANVRFAEQCKGNPIVKNSHIDYARIQAFINLAFVDINRGELKVAEENLAKAKFAWSKMREDPNASILVPINSEFYEKINDFHCYEDLDYLGINILHLQGQLNVAQNNSDDALKMYSLEIISSSRKFRNMPYLLARGYFQMATIFFQKEKISEATSYFTRTGELWVDFLENSREMAETLSYFDKKLGQYNLNYVKGLYQNMSEHVRGRNECLEICEKALGMIEKL